MLPPVAAWLSRPGELQARRGTLSIEEGRLTFVTEGGERITVRSTQLQSVRRVRGSPVLEVRYRRDADPALLLLYFVEPPPLPERQALPRPGERGMRRMAAIRKLRAANRRLKPVIQEWVRAIEGLGRS